MGDKTPFEQSRDNERFASAAASLIGSLRHRMRSRGYAVRPSDIVLTRTEMEKDSHAVNTYIWGKDFIMERKDGTKTVLTMTLDATGGLVVGGVNALDAVADAIASALDQESLSNLPARDTLQSELRNQAPALAVGLAPGRPGAEVFSPFKKTTSKEEAMPDPKKVFIIHGQNAAAVTAVEHFLRALGLEPLPFDEVAADGGLDFVGNIVLKGMERAHGIVALFTPDEYAALVPTFRSGTPDHLRWQARPNVIFEAGIAFGTARERSVLVMVGPEVKLFSDVGGIHIVRLDNTGDSRKRFRQKLIGAGCAVNLRADTWDDPNKAGDFESCVSLIAGVKPNDPFGEPGAGSTRRVDAPSPEAAAVAAHIRTTCLRSRNVDPTSYNFLAETYEEGRAFRELERLGFVTKFSGSERNWRVTDLGVDVLLADDAKTDAPAPVRWNKALGKEASALLDSIQSAYLRAKFPNYRTWGFNRTPGEDRLFAELEAHGYIEPMALGRERWRLTGAGQRAVISTPPIELSSETEAPGSDKAVQPPNAPDLREQILEVLRASARQNASRSVVDTFESLAANVGAKWGQVYEALVHLREDGLDVHLQGFTADSIFEVQFPME